MVAAGVAGASLDMSDSTTMTAMLALLGLGWNAGIVGGTTLLAASVPAALRPQTEGVREVAMGLAAGAGAPLGASLSLSATSPRCRSPLRSEGWSCSERFASAGDCPTDTRLPVSS
jgi:hypothetical protein